MKNIFKKFSAVLLSTILIFSVMVVGITVSASTTEVWNKDLGAMTPAKGAGTELEPYEITNGNELEWAVQSTESYYFKLTKDIYLNDVSKINWQTGQVDSGYTANSWLQGDWNSNNPTVKFKGTIDGDGHTVYGMYYKDTDAAKTYYYTGLIPAVSGDTTITGIGVENAYISSGNGWVSAFVGYGSAGSVSLSECYLGENVTLYGKDAGAFFAYGGGVPTIDKCYSLASISASSKWGLIAECWGTRIVSNTYAVGTCISKHNSVECTNVYATDVTGGTGANVRTIENMQGKDALTNEDKMSKLAECSAFVATNGYPTLNIFEVPIQEEETKIWNGEVGTSAPAEGDGSTELPYIITNGNELSWAIKSTSNYNFKL